MALVSNHPEQKAVCPERKARPTARPKAGLARAKLWALSSEAELERAFQNKKSAIVFLLTAVNLYLHGLSAVSAVNLSFSFRTLAIQ